MAWWLQAVVVRMQLPRSDVIGGRRSRRYSRGTTCEESAVSERFAQLPVPASGAIFKALDEGGVLFSTDSEVYFGVNVIGAQIWELLGQSTTLDQMCRTLAARYSDVSEAQIRGDVVKFLNDLVENGLAVPRSSTPNGGSSLPGSSA